MLELERYSWSEYFEKIKVVYRQMNALNLQADRILDGRSKGAASERICRERLLEIVKETELEPLVKDVIRESRDWPWVISEFVTIQFQAISKDIPSRDMDILELINLTSDVKKILKKKLPRKEELKKVADLGQLYFGVAISLLFTFERNLLEQLKQEGIVVRLNRLVPRSVISRFKQFQIAAYILGYAGIRFASYDYPTVRRTPKRWCRICFRRTAQNGSKYCESHDTSNSNKNVFRFGEKIHFALSERTQTISNWRNLRKCILEKEEAEREFNGSDDSPLNQWKQMKQSLVKLINSHPSLASRVSIEHIRLCENWIEAVKYLRVVFENEQEKSYDRDAVWCWLEMARDWFEIEDMYLSSEGKTLKSSRSPISKIPTLKLIENLCEQEPGIKKSEIARRINVSASAVGQCVRDNNDLQKYFD